MRITLICNAGLVIENENDILLVDAPNVELLPFCGIDDETWISILNRKDKYSRVTGIWFSHSHPDHCDLERVKQYQERWVDIPIFVPEWKHLRGKVRIGSFEIEYQKMNHAPIPNAPAHMVTWIETGQGSVYLPADAELNCEAHRSFAKGRKATAAFWNSMYLSRADTRALMKEISDQNYIYHMPRQRPDPNGYWRKLDRNMERFGAEQENVKILDHYPTTIEI